MSVPIESAPEPEPNPVPAAVEEGSAPVRGDTAPVALEAETEREVEPEEPAGGPDPPLAAQTDEIEPEGEVEPEAPRRSWLDRLLGR
jgi:hypothetical protein